MRLGSTQLRTFPVIFASAVLLHGSLMTGCGWARTRALPRRGGAPPPQPQLTVEVQEPLGLARSQWPITAGVPFPAARVKDATELRISDGGPPLGLQTRVLSRWPDGSARWVLLDWQADLKARQTRRFRVEAGGAASHGAGRKDQRRRGPH